MVNKNDNDRTVSALFIVFLLFAAGICFLIYYLDLEKKKLDNTAEEKRLRDSLSLLQKEIDTLHVKQNQLQVAYDSMLLIEPTIIYKTREKVKFIYLEANATQLDSIIRKKSKRKRRYS
jgi:hypothetical protein